MKIDTISGPESQIVLKLRLDHSDIPCQVGPDLDVPSTALRLNDASMGGVKGSSALVKILLYKSFAVYSSSTALP